jgi:hypothetical protein
MTDKTPNRSYPLMPADSDQLYQVYNEMAAIADRPLAYGGVGLDIPAALGDLGAGWTTLIADIGVLANPKDVVQDFASDGIRFVVPGFYNMAITIALEHNELNASRVSEIRLYNVTDAVAVGDGTTVGTARNQAVTNYSTLQLVEVSTAGVGDLFVVQMGNGSDYTGITLLSFSFTITSIG